MKVVMLQDVGGVGQRGKVVEVSDGYALNFLIPQGKAVQGTPDTIAAVQKKQEAESAQRAKEEAATVAAIQALENAEIKCTAKASEKGGLFKAITASEIARAINEQKNVDIPIAAVQLDKPIKEVGEYTVSIKKDKAASKMRLVVVAA
jgi:large subunit ribosomal protein L9